MTRKVRLSLAALGDIRRLADFLASKSPSAARKAVDAISAAVHSLDQHAERGRSIDGGLRELAVRFGRDGYIVRYRIDDDVVVVSRIFHTREQR